MSFEATTTAAEKRHKPTPMPMPAPIAVPMSTLPRNQPMIPPSAGPQSAPAGIAMAPQKGNGLFPLIG